MEDDETNGCLSTLYHVLRARRRRRTIRILSESDDPVVPVRFLAQRVAAAENDLPLAHATGEPYRNAYNALSQTHLPTLAEAGVVIYDPKRQQVSSGENFTTAVLLIVINRPVVRTFFQTQLGTNAEDLRER